MNTTTFEAATHIKTDENFAHRWWVFALRGLLACLFGLVALLRPGVTLLTLVLVFAAYSLIDGALWIYAAVQSRRRGQPWGLPLLNSLLGIAVGILAVMWPVVTVVAFVLLVAVWSLLAGWLMLIAAIRSRRHAPGRGWRIFGGIVSIVFAALLLISPFVGALVLTLWLGGWAVAFGAALMFLAFQLRSPGASGGSDAATTQP